MNEDTKPSVMVDNGRGGPGWRYQCKSCGYKVGLDAAYPKECPGCHAPGWWGCLVTPVISQNGVKKDGDTVKTTNIKASEGIKTRKGILSQEETPLVHCQPYSEGDYEPIPRNGRGRPRQPVPEDLIKDLDHQGFSSRAIEGELDKQRFKVGYKTIQRVLSGKRNGCQVSQVS